jgi:MOSC domain-containing protein YiiM
MTGKVIGLARHAAPREPIEELQSVNLSPDYGVEGDCKGVKFPDRQVTILALEDWREALFSLADGMGGPDLPWTTRRANVLTEGVKLPRGIGSIIMLGDALLEVTMQTTPCSLMDRFHHGLRLALAPEWRGGVTCRVVEGALVKMGDTAAVTIDLPERKVRLPG